MKTLFFAVALVLCISAFTQEAPDKDRTFIRVFDLEGKKFAKGKVLSVSDTSLLLKGEQPIDLKNIGFLKTKRSTGNNVLIGMLSGALISGAIIAATADPDDWIFPYTAGEGFLLGAMIGASPGALFGWISSLFKKSRTYIINGDVQQWREFQEFLGASE